MLDYDLSLLLRLYTEVEINSMRASMVSAGRRSRLARPVEGGGAGGGSVGRQGYRPTVGKFSESERAGSTSPPLLSYLSLLPYSLSSLYI